MSPREEIEEQVQQLADLVWEVVEHPIWLVADRQVAVKLWEQVNEEIYFPLNARTWSQTATLLGPQIDQEFL